MTSVATCLGFSNQNLCMVDYHDAVFMPSRHPLCNETNARMLPYDERTQGGVQFEFLDTRLLDMGSYGLTIKYGAPDVVADNHLTVHS